MSFDSKTHLAIGGSYFYGGFTEISMSPIFNAPPNTSCKLQIRIECWDKFLLVHTLFMHPSTLTASWHWHNDSIQDSWELYSASAPDIGARTLYLWGNTPTARNKLLCHTYSSKENCIRAKGKLLESVLDWSINWPRWETREINLLNLEDRIYAF